MMIWMILSALALGLTCAFLLWGGRGWLVGKFRRDAAWVRETRLKFNPAPINAELYVQVYYAGLVVLLVALIFLTPTPIVGVGLWLVIQMLPKIITDYLWKQRRKKIDLQLPATIAAMCNSIRAGLTTVQAIQRLAEQAPDPICTEFKIIAAQYAYGADLESVIRDAKMRLNLPNFNLFASAMLLNREMGGNVADTLSRISKSLDKLHQMRLTVEAHTSEGRTNIKVLLIAPVVMLLMLSTVDYDGVKMLFTTPQGAGVLLVAAALTGTGVYFAMRITRTEI